MLWGPLLSGVRSGYCESAGAGSESGLAAARALRVLGLATESMSLKERVALTLATRVGYLGLRDPKEVGSLAIAQAVGHPQAAIVCFLCGNTRSHEATRPHVQALCRVLRVAYL